jgi:CubicO group peptidase (beta-lactamase class C family)
MMQIPFFMKPLILLLALALLNSGCAIGFTDRHPYQPPVMTGDGIATGTLAEVKIDSQMILKALGRIEQGTYGEVHSLLIYKDDKLVLEEYFDGHEYQWDAPKHHGELVSWNRDLPHCIHSVSKSITSLCVGIAIDQGFIENEQQSIFDYLPDHQHLRTEETKYITIEHLLSGTSGLQWAEWSAPLSSMANDQVAIYFSGMEPVDYVLGKPMVAAPGTHFTYSGGNIDVLAVIVENASGMSFQEFSRNFLFEPLGLDSAYWDLVYPTGEVQAASGMKATPRELVKIGAMMLQDGSWKGKQILSEHWVEKCRDPYLGSGGIHIPGEDMKDFGYSYAWWTRKIRYRGQEIHWYSGNGWGGQKLIVLPDINTVVVFTGARYTKKVREYEIFERFILPAVSPLKP